MRAEIKKNILNVWSYLDEYQKEKIPLIAAVKRVFASGKLILGEEGKKFEIEFAKYCGRRFGIGVNSGTDALFLGLKTLGIGPGDEVITVANTAIPTASAICSTGATPVFVDVCDDTLLMDPTKIAAAITRKTKCIVPVHLYGQCCDMESINTIARKYQLLVLEDCAQATGAKWGKYRAGSMSDLAAFSFYPTKILGAYGDGGMMITNSAQLAKKAKMFRMYGTDGDYYSYFLGYNSRLDEVQAAILRFKLRKIATYLKKRLQLAKRYDLGLTKTQFKPVATHPNASHSYYLYVCRHRQRDKIIEYLRKFKINVNISYKYPLHLMKAFRYLGYKAGDLPVTELAAKEIFSLPTYPDLKLKDQNRVLAILKQFSPVN